MQTDFSLRNVDQFTLLVRQQTSEQAVLQCQNPTNIENFQILCFNILVLQFPSLYIRITNILHLIMTLLLLTSLEWHGKTTFDWTVQKI